MLSALLSSPRRLLATLAVLLAATGVAVGSGATFSSSSANAGNAFTSGTLLHSNSKAGQAILTAGNMKPGDSKTSDVTITNTGNLAGVFTVSEAVAGTDPFVTKMQLKVVDTKTSSTVYEGAIGGLASKALGEFAKGEARTFAFTVTFPRAATNADQGKSVSATYTWDAVQKDGEVLAAN